MKNVILKAGDLNAAIKRCAGAMPASAIIPITEFLMVDGDRGQCLVINEQCSFRCDVDVQRGSASVLLHKSAFPFLSALPPDTEVTLSPGLVSWAGGKMKVQGTSDEYPEWPATDGDVPATVVEGAAFADGMGKVIKFLNPKENELSGFHPVWIIDRHVIAGSTHQFATVHVPGCETSKPIAVPRDSARLLQGWASAGSFYMIAAERALHLKSVDGTWGASIVVSQASPKPFLTVMDSVHSTASFDALEITDSVRNFFKTAALAPNVTDVTVSVNKGRLRATADNREFGSGIDMGMAVDCAVDFEFTVPAGQLVTHLANAESMRISKQTIQEVLVDTPFFESPDYRAVCSPIYKQS